MQESMYQLGEQWRAYQTDFVDPTLLGNFVDNHDNARFMNDATDTSLYKGALAWVMLTDGIPMLVTTLSFLCYVCCFFSIYVYTK